MTKTRRIREALSGPLDVDYLKQRMEGGWRPVAIEWEQDTTDDQGGGLLEEVPYGLRVAGDGVHLEENPGEKQVMMLIMELIVLDHPLSYIATELNRRGFRTRHGAMWSPVSVFNLLPRLIEMGPRIFSSEEWIDRRPHLYKLVAIG